MNRFATAIVLLTLPTGALATPFVLDLEMEGLPAHNFSSHPLFGNSISERWVSVDAPRPPAGTTSVDVRLTLPNTFRTTADLSDLTFEAFCDWGSRGSSAGSQRIDLLTTSGAGVETDTIVSDATLRVTGPDNSPDSVSISAVGPMEGGDSVTFIRMFADDTAMSPTPVGAGSGSCVLGLSIRGDSSLEDTPLFERPALPLSDTAGLMSVDAQTAYDARFESRPTPDAARVEMRLSSAHEALIAGGCLVDERVEGMAGAYGSDGATGFDGNGPITDAVLSRSPKTFSGTLSDGTTFGGADFSAYNRQGQIFAERDDGGFVVGRFGRVRGTRGVWHVLTGTCDGPTTAAEALQDWYKAERVVVPL